MNGPVSPSNGLHNPRVGLLFSLSASDYRSASLSRSFLYLCFSAFLAVSCQSFGYYCIFYKCLLTCMLFTDLPRIAFLFCLSPLTVTIYPATYWLSSMELHFYFLLYHAICRSSFLLFIFFVGVSTQRSLLYSYLVFIFFSLCRLRSSQSIPGVNKEHVLCRVIASKGTSIEPWWKIYSKTFPAIAEAYPDGRTELLDDLSKGNRTDAADRLSGLMRRTDVADRRDEE